MSRQHDQLLDEIFTAHSIRADSVKFRYQFVNKGFSAKLSDEELKSLEADPRIKRVTPNFLISYGIDNTTNNIRFLDDKAEESLVMNQSTSWGVVRVGGPFEGSGIGRKA